jgi:hypothetical protein
VSNGRYRYDSKEKKKLATKQEEFTSMSSMRACIEFARTGLGVSDEKCDLYQDRITAALQRIVAS